MIANGNTLRLLTLLRSPKCQITNMSLNVATEYRCMSNKIYVLSNRFRARSQIPVVGVTGSAPGWPGALKLPGAAV